MTYFLRVLMLILTGLFLAVCSYGEVGVGRAKATFAVHCYTVGEHALRGQSGVLSVEPGWRDFREVDRVIFDPDKISVKQMEELLRRAGTYRETVEVIDARPQPPP